MLSTCTSQGRRASHGDTSPRDTECGTGVGVSCEISPVCTQLETNSCGWQHPLPGESKPPLFVWVFFFFAKL